ncbi:bifunctional 2-polyprenyl-6-hydroxyphenol methylase/3-demethylubiquinol 3-O-methyltransferase UbiG [Synechococcus sp. CS-1332]|uniref:class I SAM-dependent methyltransferase n=1 Tax=Synechococcus sp. CS-1332 TaxID=2847972 RepID=UPI00223AD645|nr:class I SAM-dependent methyltransferase [Synechococcus sp. CS-1332]MCT0209040.1 class I SAM-dependent methyltransferase [Synechococcus sp. CS-1332]
MTGGSMFRRPVATYGMDSESVGRILLDPANPLCLISEGIKSGTTVLDVGAGNGVLAQLFLARGISLCIDGVEPSADAVSLASCHYRHLHHGALAEVMEHLSPTTYDHVVLADVIEHTVDPSETLSLASALLGADGRIWISLPNVAFAPIRAELLHGSWTYSDWGILERSHLRFFTKASLKRLISDAGLEIETIYHLGRSPFCMEKKLQDYPLNMLTLLQMKADPLAFTYQFLAICRVQSKTGLSEMTEKWIDVDRRLLRKYYSLRSRINF